MKKLALTLIGLTFAALPGAQAWDMEVQVPSGTTLSVELSHALSGRGLLAGDDFEGRLVGDLRVREQLVAPAGSIVRGLVTDVDEGQVRGGNELVLVLTAIDPGAGARYRLRTASARHETGALVVFGSGSRQEKALASGTRLRFVLLDEAEMAAIEPATPARDAGRATAVDDDDEDWRRAARTEDRAREDRAADASGSAAGRTSSSARDETSDARTSRDGASDARTSRDGRDDHDDRDGYETASASTRNSDSGRTSTRAGARDRVLELPAGTEIVVVLSHAIESRYLRVGDQIAAKLTAPLVVDGRLLAPEDAAARIEVADYREAGRVQGREEVTLRLGHIANGDGDNYRVRTEPATHTARSTEKKDAATVGGSTLAGAILGGILDGKDGVKRGAGVGVATGAVVVLATRGEEVRLPAGTPLQFALAEPVRMRDLGPAPESTAARDSDRSVDAGASAEPASVAPPRLVEGDKKVELGTGTELRVRLRYGLKSRELAVGDTIVAELASPLDGAGRRLAEAGAEVRGRVTANQTAGRIEGREELVLTIASLRSHPDREPIAIRTTAARQVAEDGRNRDLKTVGIGAAAGAVLGAIKDGADGAVKGAVLGAAVGGVVVLSTRGEEVHLPAGTELSFTLAEPARLPVLGRTPRASSSY